MYVIWQSNMFNIAIPHLFRIHLYMEIYNIYIEIYNIYIILVSHIGIDTETPSVSNLSGTVPYCV